MIKILILFLILVIGLYANDPVNTSKTISIDSLNKIIENGWDENNSTYQAFIATMSQKRIDHYLALAKKPIQNIQPTIDNPVPTPKMLLTRNDYTHLLGYCKYLESKHREKEAIEIYLEILEGLYRIDEKSFLSFIFRIVIEGKVRKNLKKHSIKFQLTFDKKKHLHHALSNILILDTHLLWRALDYDRICFKKLLTKWAIRKITHHKIDTFLAREIMEQTDKLLLSFTNSIRHAKTKKELTLLKENNAIEAKRITSAYQKWIKQDNNTYSKTDLSKIISEYFFTIGHIRVYTLIEEIQDNIKENKKLLHTLETP